MTAFRIFMIFLGYLSGSVPFGMIIAKMMGAGDIRQKGSGNIGATNVLRTTGKLGGAMTLLFDALKGAVPVLIAKSLWGLDVWTLAIALAAIIGHNYTVFLKFRGGKGVATSMGVIFSLWPYIGLITIGIWIGSMFLWKYSSLAALISFGFFPVITAIGERHILFIIFSLIISSLLYFRHIENIRRLVAGKEGKIGAGGMKAVILASIILASSGMANAESPAVHDRLVPVEIEKLWMDRQIAINAGNTSSADLILEEIVRTRYRLGINRIDDIAALLVREGYLSMEKGAPDNAYHLSLVARDLSPDYAPSYYLSAKSLRHMSKAGIGQIFYEYSGGVKATLRDFWTSFNLAGRLYSIILLGAGFTILVFTASLCCRTYPLFFHTFKELTAGFTTSPFNIIFFLIIAFIPILFGIAWFVLIWIVLSWIYMSRNDRILAVICIIFFLFLPTLLKYSSIFATAHNNIILRGLVAADRGYGEPELIEHLKDHLNIEPGNEYLTFGIAFLSNKDGKIDESQQYFERLITSGNRTIRINAINSLGNISFYRGNYDKAVKYYTDAIRESPESPIPVYNLSQAYREKLLFAEAEETYNKAKSINLHDVERFTALSAKGSGYRVIEYPVAKRDMWRVALTSSNNTGTLSGGIIKALIRIPAERFPFLGISIGIILSVLSYIKPGAPMAYNCPACHSIVCGRCTGSKIFGGVCRTCKSREQEGGPRSMSSRRIYYLIPGLWHMIRGQTAKGIILGIIFCTGIAGIISEQTVSTWNTAYYMPEWPSIFWISLIILSYILVFFTGIRPFRSGQMVRRNVS